MKFGRKWAAALFVASLAIAVTGCGSGGDAQSSASQSSQAPQRSVRVAFIGDSAASDIIWSYRVEKMKEEAGKLGVEFVDRYANGDFSAQARMIEEEVARGTNAIIATFFDPKATDAAVKSALDKGVAIYALMGAPTLGEADMKKISYAATDWKALGTKLGEAALPSIADGGTVLWPAETAAGNYITDAVEGFEEEAVKAGKKVTVNVLEVTSDPTTATSRILNYITSHSDTAAVVTSGAIAIGAANQAMRQGALTAGKPPLFGQVVDPTSVQGVIDGFMPAGVNLELTESSYEAVRVVVATARDNAAPVNSTIPTVIVQTDNLETTVPEELRG